MGYRGKMKCLILLSNVNKPRWLLGGMVGAPPGFAMQSEVGKWCLAAVIAAEFPGFLKVAWLVGAAGSLRPGWRGADGLVHPTANYSPNSSPSLADLPRPIRQPPPPASHRRTQRGRWGGFPGCEPGNGGVRNQQVGRRVQNQREGRTVYTNKP